MRLRKSIDLAWAQALPRAITSRASSGALADAVLVSHEGCARVDEHLSGGPPSLPASRLDLSPVPGSGDHEPTQIGADQHPQGDQTGFDPTSGRAWR